MSNLTELPRFKYNPETETMWVQHGTGWAELDCYLGDWKETLPEWAQDVVVIDT